MDVMDAQAAMRHAVQEALRAQLATQDSQRTWAVAADVPRSVLGDALRGQRNPRLESLYRLHHAVQGWTAHGELLRGWCTLVRAELVAPVPPGQPNRRLEVPVPGSWPELQQQMADLVRELAELGKLDITELAEASGLSRQGLYDILDGGGNPRAPTLAAIGAGAGHPLALLTYSAPLGLGIYPPPRVG